MIYLNLPVFRAEIKNIEESPGLYQDLLDAGSLVVIDNVYYVIGYLGKNQYKQSCIMPNGSWCSYVVNRDTIAIHFSDMIDSEGNKIFASLSENGKGGDILFSNSELEIWVAEFTSKGFKIYEYLDNNTVKNNTFLKNISGLKVIGIQK